MFELEAKGKRTCTPALTGCPDREPAVLLWHVTGVAKVLSKGNITPRHSGDSVYLCLLFKTSRAAGEIL